MLRYIKCDNDVYCWDLTQNYENLIDNQIFVKPNHNNTLSLMYAINEHIDLEFEDQLLLLCYIHKPVTRHNYTHKCTCCYKSNSLLCSTNGLPLGNLSFQQKYGGLNLFLCQECINNIQKCYKVNSVVMHDDLKFKAVIRNNDVLFLYHHVIPIKNVKSYKCKGCQISGGNNCECDEHYEYCNYCGRNKLSHMDCEFCYDKINKMVDTLFINYYYIKQLLLVLDVQYYLYHTLINIL